MKKIFPLSLLLWVLTLGAGAQNMYRNYASTNNVPRPISAVSIVNRNGYVYYFQADANGHLSATEIDPLTMLPTGNANCFVFQQLYFYANGGFEDASGNFVLYGYRLSNPNNNFSRRLAYITITPGLSSCDIYYDPSGNYGEFTAGCDGFNQNAEEFYMFVNNRNLAVVEVTTAIFQQFELDAVNHPNDYYCDVSWDAAHGKFIATGFAWNTSIGYKNPFVDVVELVNITTINHTSGYIVANPPFAYSNEYKTLHVQLDNDNLLLYNDLRHLDGQYEYDVIWLTRILDFWDINSATVAESWSYELPNTKLSATDMIYDPYNNRLNFLGYLNRCMDGLTHILAQVNPYMLSSGIEIGQLGAAFLGGVCLNDQPPYEDIAYNNLKMYNLALNIKNPCNPILIAGVVYGQKSVLTETYDISLSTCDAPMWHADNPASPALKPYPHNTTLPITFITYTSPYDNPDPIAMSYICDEPEACSHQFGGKSLQQSLPNNPTVEISIEYGKLFVCEGFEGVVRYSLYDMAGKLLQQGETRNGEPTSLKVSVGVYFIRAKDAAGNQLVKKVVVTE